MKKTLSIILITILSLACFCACAKQDGEIWGKVSGVVTENDAPLSGVKVTAGSVVTYTDADGYYCLDVGEGGETVTFEKEGCLTLSKTFNANSFYRDEITFNATMFFKSKVFGKVTVSGQAVQGADVTLGARTVKTDTEGNYSFDNVLCVDTVVIVSFDGKGAQKPVYYSELKDGNKELNFDLE